MEVEKLLNASIEIVWIGLEIGDWFGLDVELRYHYHSRTTWLYTIHWHDLTLSDLGPSEMRQWQSLGTVSGAQAIVANSGGWMCETQSEAPVPGGLQSPNQSINARIWNVRRMASPL